jgi:hypothetical protein
MTRILDHTLGLRRTSLIIYYMLILELLKDITHFVRALDKYILSVWTSGIFVTLAPHAPMCEFQFGKMIEDSTILTLQMHIPSFGRVIFPSYNIITRHISDLLRDGLSFFERISFSDDLQLVLF